MDGDTEVTIRQRAADAAEALAVARYLVIRETFTPCWGRPWERPVRLRPQPRTRRPR